MTPANPVGKTGKLFATMALVEAATWTGLLLGMVLKYVTETTDLGVWLFGRLHGLAFLVADPSRYAPSLEVRSDRARPPVWAKCRAASPPA